MKLLVNFLFFLLVSTIVIPIYSKEIGILYLWEISSGRKAWEIFGDDKYQQKFTGSISNGKPNGKGILSYPNGKQVKGEWVEGKEQKGFSFRVTREDKEDSTNKASFVIALNYGEAVLLKTYLRHALKESFNLVDKKREEYFKNNYNKQGSNSPQEEYVQPVEVEEDDLW